MRRFTSAPRLQSAWEHRGVSFIVLITENFLRNSKLSNWNIGHNLSSVMDTTRGELLQPGMIYRTPIESRVSERRNVITDKKNELQCWLQNSMRATKCNSSAARKNLGNDINSVSRIYCMILSRLYYIHYTVYIDTGSRSTFHRYFVINFLVILVTL